MAFWLRVKPLRQQKLRPSGHRVSQTRKGGITIFVKLKRNYKKIIESRALFNLLGIKFFGFSRPTIVSWALTNRCNQRCLYCRIWNKDTPELEKEHILSIIDKLFFIGVRLIIFTGGEPLLRDDIEEIVNYAHNKRMYVSLNTNGRLVRQKIRCLRSLDEFNLSIDGPEKINDYLRGQGSFKSTVEAIELAKKHNIPALLTTVLSKDNLGCIDFLLAFARKYKTKIGFQPASLIYLGGDEANPLSPALDEYKKAVSRLIECKLQGNKNIVNSLTGLRHIHNFPEEKKIPCLAGKFMFKLQPDGNMLSCSWGLKGRRQKTIEIEDIFHRIDIGITSCSSCWCYNITELNLMSSFKLEPILNAVRCLF